MEKELILERAAIMEYDGGMTRDEAEAFTAKSYGYETWKEMMDASKLQNT
jgi:hypothetical protein